LIKKELFWQGSLYIKGLQHKISLSNNRKVALLITHVTLLSAHAKGTDFLQLLREVSARNMVQRPIARNTILSE
jgi:hypothetical protein